MKRFSTLTLAVFIPVTAHASSNDIFDINIPTGGNTLVYPQDLTVITATKMRQPLRDTPASVTVITKKQIEMLGIRSVPEALRLVPGMAVGVRAGNGASHQISYEGAAVYLTRRLQVLIDDIEVMRLGTSRVDWPVLPVNIQEIERIEVTRSPSSSVYGANSFEAVINIITQHPQDTQYTRGNIFTGDNGTTETYVSKGVQFNNTTANFSASRRKSNGFNRLNDAPVRDGSQVDVFRLKGVTEFNMSSLEYQFTKVNGALQAENGDPNRISNSDNFYNDYTGSIKYLLDMNKDHRLSFSVDTHKGELKENWDTCYPAITLTAELRDMFLANPEYAQTLLAGGIPSGGTTEDDQLALAVLTRAATMTNPAASDPVCGTVNENALEKRVTYKVEDTVIFNDALRLSSGLGVTTNYVDSETYIGGVVRDTAYHAFANGEYRLDKFLINAGLMIEKEENRVEDLLFSPRIGINYHLTESDTLRFIFAKAHRTPDINEISRNWSYTMRNITPPLDGVTDEALFYFKQSASGPLKAEEITSYEISYYGDLPTLKGSLDIKLFQTDLSRLITQKIAFFNYDPNNETSAKHNGIEVEFKFVPADGLNIDLGYAYLKCQSNNDLESQDYCSKNSGFITAIWDLPQAYTLSAGYYNTDNVSGFPYKRGDIVLSKQFNVFQSPLNARIIVRHYSDNMGFIVNDTSMATLGYENDNQLFAELDITF